MKFLARLLLIGSVVALGVWYMVFMYEQCREEHDSVLYCLHIATRD